MIAQFFKLILAAAAIACCSIAFISALEVPSAPFVDLTVLGSDLIAVNFSAPLSDGGAAINSYKVDWDTDPGIHEVQTITTSTYIGPNEIQSITLSAPDINEIQYLRTYSGEISEVQRVTITDATSGYFFLELDTSVLGGSLQYSGYIQAGAVATSGNGLGADVQSIISAMSNIKPFGPVAVTKSTFGNEERYFVTFPESMGDVPEMKVHATQLLPFGTARAVVGTDIIGNIVSGSYRLEFESQITGSIAYDATADEVRSALEKLSTIDSVVVTRSVISNQHDYDWTIEFNSPMNDGNVAMIKVYTDLMRFSNPTSFVVMNVTSRDGNEISGQFSVGFSRIDGFGNVVAGQTALMSSKASADEFKAALESMMTTTNPPQQVFPNGNVITNGIVPTAAISVSRTGPDGQKGYSWTVTFLNDFLRTFEGDLNPFTADITVLGGTSVAKAINEVKKGSKKEVQLIRTSSVNTTLIAGNYMMKLKFKDQWTQPILLRPDQLTCNASTTEIQVITTETKDSTTSNNGDDEISMYLQFRLKYGKEVTNWIPARPDFADTTCASTAARITTELQMLKVFDIVNVNSSMLSNSRHTCRWTVSFVSSIGNLNQLEVQAYNSFSYSTGMFGPASIAGDDTVKVRTATDGVKNAIKAALELLDNVGQVTVTPEDQNQGALGACGWRVTFDTNAGDLDLMKVSISNPSGDNTTVGTSPASSSTLHGHVNVDITEYVKGTSSIIGGNFALTFRGARTMYIPYDASAALLEEQLEILDTIRYQRW